MDGTIPASGLTLMGDFLGRLGSEFKLGQTNGPMMTSQIKMPDTDLGNGIVIPGGTQAIQHPSARPTFLTSFLANLPSAIAGGVANSMHPGGGFATGLAGGFQGIEQHNLLMNQLQNQNFERQLQQSRENREQAQFQSDEALKKQQLAQSAFSSRFKINFDDKGSAVNVFDQQAFQKAVDNGAQPQDALTQALTTHPIGAQEDVPKIADAIAKQAGIDIGKFTPAEMGSYLFAQREATRTHSAKPIEDFYNKLMTAEQKQQTIDIPSMEPLTDNNGTVVANYNRKKGTITPLDNPQGFRKSGLPPVEVDKVREQVSAIDRTTEIAQRVQSNLPLLNNLLDAKKISLSTNPQGFLSASVARGAKLSDKEAQLAGDIASLSEHINVLRQPLGATGFRGPEAFAALQAQAGNLMGNPAVTKQVLGNTIKALKGIRKGHMAAFPQLDFGAEPSDQSGQGASRPLLPGEKAIQ